MKTTTEIKYYDVPLIITGNYEKSEKEIRYDNNLEGYKGSPSSFELLKVETLSGDDITGIFFDFQREDIIELVLINLEE
jgi:hypothetical protein